jgi:hypothetical protein
MRTAKVFARFRWDITGFAVIGLQFLVVDGDGDPWRPID